MTSQLPCFWCLFLSCQQQKDSENGAAVTSFRSFLFRDNFRNQALQVWFLSCGTVGKSQVEPHFEIALSILFLAKTSEVKNNHAHVIEPSLFRGTYISFSSMQPAVGKQEVFKERNELQHLVSNMYIHQDAIFFDFLPMNTVSDWVPKKDSANFKSIACLQYR